MSRSMHEACPLACTRYLQPWSLEPLGQEEPSRYRTAFCFVVVALVSVVLIAHWRCLRTPRAVITRDVCVGTESSHVLSRDVTPSSLLSRPSAVRGQPSRLPSAVFVARRYGTVYHTRESCSNLHCSQSTAKFVRCDFCRSRDL